MAELLVRQSTAGFGGTRPRVETLSLDPSGNDIVKLQDDDSYVKPGDTAVQVIGDEFGDID